MKLQVFSRYNGDNETRFGDCIMLYNDNELVIYDCGHDRHAEEVLNFLGGRGNKRNAKISIIVSHNDSDHTKGVNKLLTELSKGWSDGSIYHQYNVTVYTSLYLKHARKVLSILDDGRRTLPATKEHILKYFDHIKEIVNLSEKLKFTIKDAVEETVIVAGICKLVGPNEDNFVTVVAKAIENKGTGQINGETVKNAASVQLACKLENENFALLCGDASPSYLPDLSSYRIVQLPHHGNYDSALEVFEKIPAASISEYTFIISDNTGNSKGGSDSLMANSSLKKGKVIRNTKNGNIIEIKAPIYASTQETSHSYGIWFGL